MDFLEFKEWLVFKIEGAADWRAQKAEEYPDDARNASSSRALTKLAKGLAALPDDHEKIRALWRTVFGLAADEDAAAQHREDLNMILSRYGFDGDEDGNAEAFLSQILDEWR